MHRRRSALLILRWLAIAAVAVPAADVSGQVAVESNGPAGAAARAPHTLKLGFARVALPVPLLPHTFGAAWSSFPAEQPLLAPRPSLGERLAAGRSALLAAGLRSGGVASEDEGGVVAGDDPAVAAAAAPGAGSAGVVSPGARTAGGARDAAVDSAGGAQLLSGFMDQYADLSVRLTGLGELGGSWTRYRPCDPSVHFNCNPSLFPVMRPNVEFGVQVAGTISERVHVDVDYDQRREDFEAANRIRVYYQGLEHEMLQRVEVGDVSLALPRSRFVTRGVPAGNFGFMARAARGPFEVQALWAQQKGAVSTREFKLDRTGGGGLVQDDEIVLDDADYAKGQFFFLVEPDSLRDAPHVDVLALLATDAPPTLRPDQGGAIELYRDERLSTTDAQQQAQLGLFLADAVSADGALRHTGRFRRLVPDEDYWLHASGLWIVLRSPLRLDESLALAYVTESGDTVGRLGAERAPVGTTPELRLLRGPISTHQPGRATWPYEMRQVYRVNSSSDVDAADVQVRISAGDLTGGRTFVSVAGRQVPYLRLFGLDEDAPRDAIDAAQIFQPARESFGSTRIGGTFVVFPTLEPFLTPPPVPSEGLTATEALAALGLDANATIYEDPDPVLRDGGGRFRLSFRYRLQVQGAASAFNLGAFGIREGTERLRIGERALERDIDYTIDYELGMVTLLDPDGVFGAGTDAALHATWEQRSLFDIAPTNLFGMTANWSLGERGAFSLLGLYQSERSLYARPQLGVEPGAVLLGGAGLSLDLGGAWLDELLNRSPLLASESGARLGLEAELALSAPNPNREGVAYLDDFEAGDDTPLDVRRQQWRLGSAPDSHTGDDGTFPAVFDASTAARLVWQHDIASGGLITGNLLPSRDLDTQIRVAGTPLPEPVMWLSFGGAAGPAPGESGWRSMTTVLSTTGRDMSRSEFIEFYARADAAGEIALVLDIGSISEDAFFVDAQGAVTGVNGEGRPWGLGVLDEEASTASREVWGADRDAVGLWDQPCAAEPLKAYPLGDANANCTRGNGTPDSEDLDGNGVLDGIDGDYFRYVVRLDQASQYLVRDTVATGTSYQLYRIPLRTGAGLPVNGASDATWRFVKHLRLTVVGAADIDRQVSLARLRIIGARWTKRDGHGIQRGILGDEPGIGAGTTELSVGPVGTLTDGAAYSPPPGVTDEVQDPATQFGATGVEFNEQSLRLRYGGLEPGDRAEVYLRYPQQPRNLLVYRQLRMWVVPREGAWGFQDGDRLVVKAGTDPKNFYLFQTPLRQATGDRALTQSDWLPEVVIDFGAWFDLKARAERRAASGIGPDTLWSEDGQYAIVLEDRARAPNLAAVRELAIGVYNGGAVPSDGEVWIDELRLGTAVTDAGIATAVGLDLRSGFVDASIGYTRRGGQYRQLEEEATYQSAGALDVSTRLRLGRLLPAAWRIEAPLSIEYGRTDLDPMFLERTDVRADRLGTLREAGTSRTRVGLQLRRAAPEDASLADILVAGATLRLGWGSSTAGTFTARDESAGFDAGLDYRLSFARRAIDVLPGFVEAMMRWLAPGAIERSDAFQRLVDSRMRVTPEALTLGTALHDRENRAYRYDGILAGPADAPPILAPRQGLDNNAELRLAPFGPISATFSLRSSRDLLEPERATARADERDALRRARGSLAGADIGWETRRTLGTTVSIRPTLADWIRPSYTYTNRFSTDRDPSYLAIVEGIGGGPVLQRRFGSDRQITRRVDLRPGRLFELLIGGAAPAPQAPDTAAASTVAPDSAASGAAVDSPAGPAEPGGIGGALFDLARAFQSLDVTWSSGLNSRFERETFAPGLGYQFGLGGVTAFRVIGVDTSVYALDREDVRIGSGFALPLGANMMLAYQRTRVDGIDFRGGSRADRTRTWPDLRVSWRDIPVPPALDAVVTGANIGAGWAHSRRTSEYGATGGFVRGGTDDQFPLEIGIRLAGGVSATYTATLTRGTVDDPTGDAENRAANHALRVTGAFAPPAFLQPRITAPIRATLSFADDVQHRCRLGFGGTDGDCVPYVDTGLRTIDLTLDASLADLSIGLRLDYTDRRNRVGTQTGSKQFQIGLFGRFEFASGPLPAEFR